MITLTANESASPQRARFEKTLFDYLDDPKATSSLPSLKSVLTELEALTQQTNIRLEAVTQLVAADLGLSLRVLRLANSVYYAPSEPILDVQDAILYIGLNTFRSAIVSAPCIENTSRVQPGVLDWKEFWTHAAGVGHIARELSTHLMRSDLSAESFYLMGLFHDIGKVVLAQLAPDQFDTIYRRAQAENGAPAPLEMEALGIDHGHLGAWYLEKQGLPASIYEAVRFHHFLVAEDKPHCRHALVIRLADLIALHVKLGQSGNCAETPDPFLSEEWTAYLALCPHSDPEGSALKDHLVDSVERICDLVHQVLV